MTDYSIRNLTPEDLEATCGRLPFPVHGRALDVDGELAAIFGVMFRPECVAGFLDVTEVTREHPRVLKPLRAAWEQFLGDHYSGYDIVAHADRTERNPEGVMKRAGFTQWEGDIYVRKAKHE